MSTVRTHSLKGSHFLSDLKTVTVSNDLGAGRSRQKSKSPGMRRNWPLLQDGEEANLPKQSPKDAWWKKIRGGGEKSAHAWIH